MNSRRIFIRNCILSILTLLFMIICWFINTQDIESKDNGINENTFFDFQIIDNNIKYTGIEFNHKENMSDSILILGEQGNKKRKFVKNILNFDSKNNISIKNEAYYLLCQIRLNMAGFDVTGQFRAFDGNEVIDESGKIVFKADGEIVPVMNVKNEIIGMMNLRTFENRAFFSYIDSQGNSKEILNKCDLSGNSGLQFGSYYGEHNELTFFVINFFTGKLCIEKQSGSFKTIDWKFASRIQASHVFKNNFLILEPITDKQNTVEFILLNQETLLPKKIFQYSKPDIFQLASGFSRGLSLSSDTEFIGCDKQSYFVLNLQGIATYPFSRLLIFKEDGEIVFDMKSSRINSIHTFQAKHLILLIGYDGIMVLKDKRC